MNLIKTVMLKRILSLRFWNSDSIMEMTLPSGWKIAEILGVVDAQTFEMYLKNMRSVIMSMLKHTNIVMFNRCKADTNKGSFRRNIKMLNPKALIIYEKEDGSIDNSPEEFALDLSKKHLNIDDIDYGAWYLDCIEYPEHYKEKTVTFLGVVRRTKNMKENMFGIGRYAMVCCEADMRYIGFSCLIESRPDTTKPLQDLSTFAVQDEEWVMITANTQVRVGKTSGRKKVVLIPVSIQKVEKPEEEYIYFT